MPHIFQQSTFDISKNYLSKYRKNSKNWDTRNNYHNCPTFRTVVFYSAVLCSKDADRITNREDPDQTAPWGAVWSGSALFAQTYLSQYLKLLRYPFISKNIIWAHFLFSLLYFSSYYLKLLVSNSKCSGTKKFLWNITSFGWTLTWRYGELIV